MKKFVFSFLALSLAVACARDLGTEPRPIVDTGEATGFSLFMNFAHSTVASRATGDSNAIDAEALIHTADVFVYTDTGAYIGRHHLLASDFEAVSPAPSGNYDAYKTTNPITSTVGSKNFYVGVNLPPAAASSLENQPMSFAATLVQVIPRSAINLTNGLPMFSTALAPVSLVKDPSQNTVIATVQRIVAKVTVETDAAMQTGGDPGRLGTLQFAINHQNTKYFLQQGAAPTYKDPNWNATPYVQSDYSAAGASDYVAVDTGSKPVPIARYNALYALENTSEDHTQKTLTRVTVRTTFIPQNIVSTYNQGQGSEPTPATNPNYTSNTPATFWAVTPSAQTGTVYFDNATAASNYATDKSSNVKVYDGGLCYWNIFLNLSAGQGDVVRNDFYKCNITRIVAPGNPNDSLNDPDSPPDQDTSMTVQVDILYWNTPVLANYVLVP